MKVKDFEIIDFHAHPFFTEEQNLSAHLDKKKMGALETMKHYKKYGISKICGSVLNLRSDYENFWQKVTECNAIALKIKEILGDFYIPGFHVHPDFVDESLEEIERMDKLGIKLIGELCPYLFGWSDYSCDNFSIILDEAERRNMIVSVHTQNYDSMDKMVKAHPNLKIVAAHPGEPDTVQRHIERAKFSDNYYVDLSAGSLFKNGVLKRLTDEIGADKIIYGSDYPICSPVTHSGGVLLDEFLTDDEKRKILSLNAKKLLNL